jgi:hypothetical protein
VWEIDQQIADLNNQTHTIARLHSKGILDSADFSTQTARVSQQVSTLRSQRTRLLREDANSDALADLHALDEITATITETQTHFNEELFSEIILGVTATSPTELRFRLLGGLELSEALPQPKRRGRR